MDLGKGGTGMKNKELKASMLLLLAAAIWGFAFVAQRIGIRYLGSFSFNGIRFAMGSVSLIPLLIFFRHKPNDTVGAGETSADFSTTVKSGVLAGLVLFTAASLQQIGLIYTTAGKAAFITGLYIVLVPIFGIFLKHKIHRSTWVAVVLAIIGLYLLSVNKNFTIAKGDLYQIGGAFLWAVHILLIDRFTKSVDALKLSFIQFTTCSVLSLIVAAFCEHITLHAVNQALIPLLYGGICSVGIAYTLQVVGQKSAKPSHAAIILSMESVFASIGGMLILNEKLSGRGYLGCALMMSGMLLSQLGSLKRS